MNQILIFSEYRLTIPQEKCNRLPVGPAAVMFTQVIRHFIMRQGNQRFYSVFFTGFKYFPVIRNPGTIGRYLITFGKNTGPCNRNPEYFKSHFRK